MKTMSLKQFREEGYLLELNRQFLHPRGLALAVRTDEDGEDHFLGVQDARDDPEGLVFENITAEEVAKADRLDADLQRRLYDRARAVGACVQDLPGEPGDLTVGDMVRLIEQELRFDCILSPLDHEPLVIRVRRDKWPLSDWGNEYIIKLVAASPEQIEEALTEKRQKREDAQRRIDMLNRSRGGSNE